MSDDINTSTNTPFPVSGLLDKLDMIRKWLPVVNQLSTIRDFWNAIKAGDLKKAGDCIEEVAKKFPNFTEFGKDVSDLLNAVGDKKFTKILRSVGDLCHSTADLIDGKQPADVIIHIPEMQSNGSLNSEADLDNSIEATQALASKIEQQLIATNPVQSSANSESLTVASEPQPVENPIVIISCIGLMIQVIRLVRDWKKK
jgi:hypothetical protein